MPVLIPQRIVGAPLTSGAVHDFSGLTMGTTWSVKLVAAATQSLDALHSGLQQALDQVVSEMSHWREDSDLCRFNQAEAGTWQRLPDDFFTVLSYALSVAEESDGAYDPAAGALVNLWGFGARGRYDEAGFVAPSDSAIRATRAVLGSGWRQVGVDPSARRVRQPGSMALDLSSIAKGFGVDKLAQYLEAQGVRHYLVEVGGELRGAGMKPDGQPWWVAIEQPPALRNGDGEASLIALHGLSVATSGDYRRYFDFAGQRCAHTLDPRTGYPVRNGVASVTVVHASCMAADALSTALTVLGVEQGLRFAEDRGLAAHFLLRQGDAFVAHASSALLEMQQ
jgi:thiamine biosynthesis lipoprotein